MCNRTPGVKKERVCIHQRCRRILSIAVSLAGRSSGNLLLFFRDIISAMTSRMQNNRRWIGWLLTLATIVLAMPPGASWQCLDGTPCPSNCPMLWASRSHMASCAAPSGMHCSLCAPRATVARQPYRRGSAMSCTSPKCVARVSERPVSTLQQGVEFHVPLLALPPPPVHFTFVVNETTIPVSFPIRLFFYPQCFLRPASGRAPPASV